MINNYEKFFIKDFSIFKDKKVIVRLDLNMPTNQYGEITDISRLEAVIPFLKDLSFASAKIIIISHFGEKGESLKGVADLLATHINFVKFVGGTDFSFIKEKAEELKSGDAIILENVRLFPGEMENVESLSRNLASLANIYINDAFSVSHREQASVVGIPKYLLSFFGPTFQKEVTNLSKLLTPKKPALLILGGAKISTKMNLIKRYLDQEVKVFVGGALANNIFKQKGVEVGDSFIDPKSSIAESVLYNNDLLTPTDVTLSNGSKKVLTELKPGDKIVDCGKETIEGIKETIEKANTVIMNGPIGLYEEGFKYGTEALLTLIANKKDGVTFIGGGDTLAVAKGLDIMHKFSYVSLSGGAMLTYLGEGTLPGIEAIINTK